MTPPALTNLLQPVIRRYRAWQLARGWAVCWSLSALAMLAFLSIKQTSGWEHKWTLPGIIGFAFLTGLAVWLGCRRMAPDMQWLARQIEHEHPELNSLLLAAVEQRPDANGRYSYLQQKVIAQAVEHAVKSEWAERFNCTQLRCARGAHWTTLAILAGLITLHQSPVKLQAGGKRVRILATTVEVNPGNAKIEKGSSFVVMARFTGPVPAGVNLLVNPDSEAARIVPLIKALQDPVFGTTLPDITAPFSYRVIFEDQRTEDFKVAVFEYPRLERSNVDIELPKYTGLEKQRIENTRRVTAVERSVVGVELQLNKPVKSAQLLSGDNVIRLKTDGIKAIATLPRFNLTRNDVFDLQLVDDEGRTNKVESRFFFVALPNRPPEVKFLSPKGDQRVSALQEMLFEAEGLDDFGLKGFGFGYRVAGRMPVDFTLITNSPPNQKQTFQKLISLEALGVMPDNLMSYYLWAEDFGPDGEIRRTESDIYFAEIRPFEELFRENQSAEQQGKGKGGTPSEKLAELVKEITSATWKLRRQKYVSTEAESSK